MPTVGTESQARIRVSGQPITPRERVAPHHPDLFQLQGDWFNVRLLTEGDDGTIVGTPVEKRDAIEHHCQGLRALRPL